MTKYKQKIVVNMVHAYAMKLIGDYFTVVTSAVNDKIGVNTIIYFRDPNGIKDALYETFYSEEPVMDKKYLHNVEVATMRLLERLIGNLVI